VGDQGVNILNLDEDSTKNEEKAVRLHLVSPGWAGWGIASESSGPGAIYLEADPSSHEGLARGQRSIRDSSAPFGFSAWFICGKVAAELAKWMRSATQQAVAR